MNHSQASLYDQIQEAVAFVRSRTDFQPRFGIILGTGLGNLADEIDVVESIDYSLIPHFPAATVQSHRGKLLFGYLAMQPVVVMAGRFHYYEGYSMQQVTFPVRVLQFLGIETLLITNVAGSTRADIEAGDLVFVKDHINLQPDNPLRGENDERLGVRFPDMLHTYAKNLIETALNIAKKHHIRATTGVYVALPGPNLETPAEYEFLHRIGGDVVGMSTVPEVLVARHGGLSVFVASIVSNKCYPPNEIKATTIASVIAVAARASVQLSLLLREMVTEIASK